MKNWWPSGWETSELPKLAHVLQSMPVPAHAGTAGQLPEDEMNRRSYLQPLASETTEDCGLFWAASLSSAIPSFIVSQYLPLTATCGIETLSS